MSGIVGIISQRSPAECESLVESMVDSMKHERFYTSGTYAAPKMGVYCGWVAIKGSSATDQPFLSDRQDIALILAGEFPGDSPGGLLNLYEKEEDRFFGKLNGLFSGLVIDTRRNQAFLFNDRYGSERLYWYKTRDAFYFASEAKALLLILPELRRFDPAGVAQFCAFGCTFNQKTLFQHLHLLPGGSVYSFREGTYSKRQYFDSKTWESLPVLSIESFEAKFEETFKRILPRYFESNLKIAISLTGGLDTRMIMACGPLHLGNPLTYTFTGRNGETLDDRIAGQVAEACHLSHRLVRLNHDFFSDFAYHADRGVYLTDGCLGITGAHEVYFNRQARELAPVRITGLFGSEVFRGVSTFKTIGLTDTLFHPAFASAVSAAPLELADKVNPVTAAAFRNVPWNLFGNLSAARSQVVVRTPYLDNELVALAFQAPKSLRASPRTVQHVIGRNKLVLSKIPTDRRIEDRDARLARKLRRFLFEASFKLDYLYNEGMPHWLSPFDALLEGIDSRVRIFGYHKFLHYRSWFRKALASYIREVLTDLTVAGMPFWNPVFLAQMADAHIGGRMNYTSEINTVLTLAAVDRLLFRELPRSALATIASH